MKKHVKAVLIIVGVLLLSTLISIAPISVNGQEESTGQWVENRVVPILTKSGYVNATIILDEALTENTEYISGHISSWADDMTNLYVHLYAEGGIYLGSTRTTTKDGQFELGAAGLKGTDTFFIIADNQPLRNKLGPVAMISGEVRIADDRFVQSDTYNQVKVEWPLKVSKSSVLVRSSSRNGFSSSGRYSLYVNGELVQSNTYPNYEESWDPDILYTGMQLASFNIKNTPINIKKGDTYKITHGESYGNPINDEIYVVGLVRE